jgi:hypothetical protein
MSHIKHCTWCVEMRKSITTITIYVNIILHSFNKLKWALPHMSYAIVANYLQLTIMLRLDLQKYLRRILLTLFAHYPR